MTRNRNSNDGRDEQGQFTEGSQAAQDAGREGGETTKQRHGEGFYEDIGSQSSGKFQSGDQRTEDAARKGGQASGGNTQNLNNQ